MLVFSSNVVPFLKVVTERPPRRAPDAELRRWIGRSPRNVGGEPWSARRARQVRSSDLIPRRDGDEPIAGPRGIAPSEPAPPLLPVSPRPRHSEAPNRCSCVFSCPLMS